ncbi:MAG: hypothetical protein ACU83U_06825 [Gammaproteobacteria bacterium]
MLEIQPVSPSLQIVKSQKIKRDDKRPEKQQRSKKQEVEKPDAEPIQHIDEVV